MLLQIVIWALGGVVMGALTLAARWGVGADRADLPLPWLLTLGMSLAAGILGGAAGSLLFSDLFGLPAALGVAGVAVPAAAWGLRRGRAGP